MKLYGTESLVDENGGPESTWKYGHWKTAELFLLAKDASNVEHIEQRRDGNTQHGIRPHPDPFCAWDWRFDKNGSPQRDGNETNRNLHWLARLTVENFTEAHSWVCSSTVPAETLLRMGKVGKGSTA